MYVVYSTDFNSLYPAGFIILDFVIDVFFVLCSDNATTPLATEVVDCVTEALTDAWANPSSSTDIGRSAKELIDQSRKKIATMLNAEASEVIFLSGGTEVQYNV